MLLPNRLINLWGNFCDLGWQLTSWQTAKKATGQGYALSCFDFRLQSQEPKVFFFFFLSLWKWECISNPWSTAQKEPAMVYFWENSPLLLWHGATEDLGGEWGCWRLRCCAFSIFLSDPNITKTGFPNTQITGCLHQASWVGVGAYWSGHRFSLPLLCVLDMYILSPCCMAVYVGCLLIMPFQYFFRENQIPLFRC